MMLHDKIIPGQFLLDIKNDCASQSNKLDLYSSFGYHHHHQQHHHQQQHQRLPSPPLDGEVLDLSRRCDSVETRKTPSPYNSTSSFGTASPSTHCGSPQNSAQTPSRTLVAPTPLLANKLIFSQNSPTPLPQGIASLYPLYYQNIKQETTSSPPPTAAPAIQNPLPAFPHSPAVILPQAFVGTAGPTGYTSPKSDEHSRQNSPARTADAVSILYPNILNAATTGAVGSAKSTRPFNAYPRDPMMVAAHFAASDVLWDKTSMERYSSYRKRALDDLRGTNGGHRTVTNPKMRRTNHRNGQNSESEERALESSDNDSSTGNGSSAEQSNKNDNNNNSDNADINNGGGVKDEAYYERRRKNNAAAKKSRDRRRIKEDEIAIRAAYLERQNIELLCQIDALKKQLELFTKA